MFPCSCRSTLYGVIGNFDEDSDAFGTDDDESEASATAGVVELPSMRLNTGNSFSKPSPSSRRLEGHCIAVQTSRVPPWSTHSRRVKRPLFFFKIFTPFSTS